jgi:hypothetical protein
MKGYYNNSTKIIILCLCFIFSMALKGEAANLNGNEVLASPSPFNPTTQSTYIKYYVENDSIVRVAVFNLSGTLVRNLTYPANNYTVNRYKLVWNNDQWNGRDDGGSLVSDGEYPYWINAVAWEDTITTDNTTYYPYDVIYDPIDNYILWVSDSNGTTKRIRKSTDGGAHWSTESSKMTGWVGPAYGMAVCKTGEASYTIYVLDSGGRQLFTSKDAGSTWNRYDLWTAPNVPGDIACTSRGTLYATDTSKRKLFKAFPTDGGYLWGPPWTGYDVGSNPSRLLTGVAVKVVDPNDDTKDIVLVTDNQATGTYASVFKSTNGGQSFSSVITCKGTTPNLGCFNAYSSGNGGGAYQISFDNDGYYWVSDRGYHRVQQFDPSNKVGFAINDPANGSGSYRFNSGLVSLGIFTFYDDEVEQKYLAVASYTHQKIKRYMSDNFIPSCNIFVSRAADTTAPGAIIDLSIVQGEWDPVDEVGSDFFWLKWTSPGDDDNVQCTTASSFDVRYSKTPITSDTEFNNATRAGGEPSPWLQGTVEYFKVTEDESNNKLESNTTYYLAMKSLDEVPNTSGLSNTPVSGKTGLLLDWNMVACPKQPSPNDSASVFGDDAGTDWMWYWYSTWTGTGDTDCPNEPPDCDPGVVCSPNCDGYWGNESGVINENATTIIPGKGLFIWSYKSFDPTDAEGDEISDSSYTLSLSAGWNLIGNPYGARVSLCNCEVTYNSTTKSYEEAVSSGWIGNVVDIWNGVAYVDIPQSCDEPDKLEPWLEPWKGYWIMAYHNLNLIIIEP